MNRSEVKLSKHLYPCQRILANPWIKESPRVASNFTFLWEGQAVIVNQGGPAQFQNILVLRTSSLVDSSSTWQTHSAKAASLILSVFCWACGNNSAAERGASCGRQKAAAFTAVGLQLSPIIFREQVRGAGSDLTAGSQSIKKPQPTHLYAVLVRQHNDL